MALNFFQILYTPNHINHIVKIKIKKKKKKKSEHYLTGSNVKSRAFVFTEYSPGLGLKRLKSNGPWGSEWVPLSTFVPA